MTESKKVLVKDEDVLKGPRSRPESISNGQSHLSKKTTIALGYKPKNKKISFDPNGYK